MTRILVVEDSPTQAQELAFILEDAGLEVEVAGTAEAGFRLLGEHSFEAVLTDLVLPGESGFDFCRRIKATPALGHLPVIVLTGQADPVNVLRGLEAGADGFMTKDLPPAEVVGRVQRLLRRGSVARSGPEKPTRVTFLEQEFEVRAGRDQLLNVLLSAFEDVIILHRRSEEETAQRLHAERAREEAARRYRSLVLATSQIVWMADVQGEPAGDLPGWRSFTGQSEEELRAGRWLDAVHPDDLDETRAAWEKAVATRSVYQAEYRLRRHDGAYRYFSVKAVPIRDGDEEDDTPAKPLPPGSVRGWIGCCTDITDRKRAEEKLFEAMEGAQAANRAKSAFLANMSHEIRTPMNGILGVARMLEETPMTAKQQEYLRLIHSSGEALLTVINDILDFSKIEAGKLQLSPVTFSLRQAMQDALRVLDITAKEKELRLELSVAGDVPEMVITDPGRLRQVILNLAGNAIKFTSRGEVSVSVRRAGTASDKSDTCSLLFEVSDTGIGIPKDKLAAIFRPFEQADSSTTRKFGGTGLGLAISSSLVRQMGGELQVESEPGKGSRFFFTLPLPVGQRAGSGEAAPQAEPVLSRPLRVLVAEDSEINQIVARFALTKQGHEVVMAGNGREAVEKYEKEPFDVILMDVEMPELDGFGATAQIRAAEQGTGKHMPIIGLTAHAMKGDRERCLEAGMDGYLTKPLDAKQLARELARVAGTL